MLLFTRAIFGVLSRVAPATASRAGVRQFLRPPPQRRSARIDDLLATGARLTLHARGLRVAAWRWGHGPCVALVHGWGGVGGQLATFVPPLVAKGFSAIAFDAPGHGESEGRESSPIHFAAALDAVADMTGPLHGVIAHSFGAAAATVALAHGLLVRRAAFVGPPSRLSEWLRLFGRHIGMNDAAIRAMHDEVPRYIARRWEAIEPVQLARSLSVPLLIVHDQDDDEVPVTHGLELADAWPKARLITTHGLGHRRILRDRDTIDTVTSFVMEPGRSGTVADVTSETELIERELFEPSMRFAHARR
jgi:pimeloyl-ACP methyl ester carboxylesterase